MKKETIAEFLARGGSITKVLSQEPVFKTEPVKRSAPNGPAVIMSMGEADLYYGEYKPKKVKKKSKSTIDISALPEELRIKYIDEVINGQKETDGDSEDSDGDDE
jgi:hypothetical protein